MPYILYQEGGIRVFPIEGVYAVISVKSRLDERELLDCIDNIESVKKMSKSAYTPQIGAIVNTVNLYSKEFEYFPTLGFVFAFDSIGLDEIIKKLYTKNKEKGLLIEQQIDTICVLNKGVIFNYSETAKELVATPDSTTKLAHTESNDMALVLFYLLIMHILTQVWMRPIQMTKYSKIKDLKFVYYPSTIN